MVLGVIGGVMCVHLLVGQLWNGGGTWCLIGPGVLGVVLGVACALSIEIASLLGSVCMLLSWLLLIERSRCRPLVLGRLN